MDYDDILWKKFMAIPNGKKYERERLEWKEKSLTYDMDYVM